VRWRRNHRWGSSDDEILSKRTAGRHPLRRTAEGDRTTVCTDETRTSDPATFAPPLLVLPWPSHQSPRGVQLRGEEKVWVYGALRSAMARKSRSWRLRAIQELQNCSRTIESRQPQGGHFIITDNLSSHTAGDAAKGLAEHPRIHDVRHSQRGLWAPICQEGWWRLLPPRCIRWPSFANAHEIERACTVATAKDQPESQAWIGGRRPKRGAICMLFSSALRREA